MKYTLDFEGYRNTAVSAVAEGQILLKNDNSALPLRKGTTVSVFGRMQLHYYKSGLGSGGMVNVKKVTGILEALEEEKNLKLYKPLKEVYVKWDNENPVETGIGWGATPWSQKEMPLDEDTVKDAAENSDAAVAIIARTAGEDQDNVDKEGAFRLSQNELDMLKRIRASFDRMIVILNIGNIMDFTFIDEVGPDAVLVAWQGGMAGGTGTAKVLTGEITPSGHLPVTVARELSDYPSSSTFGRTEDLFYEEDIYVGYRYFETSAREKIRFPFGYGLSYTSFTIEPVDISVKTEADNVTIRQTVEVTNTGKVKGKELILQFVSAPMGKMGKPAKVLTAYKKTRELKPGETVEVEIPALGDTLRLPLGLVNDSGNLLSHSYDCIIYPGEKISGLRPGMVIKVHRERNRTGNRLAVPVSAVFTGLEGRYVWIVEDGVVQKRDIVPGGYTEDGIVVSEGLREGDLVIVEGARKVCSGMKVRTER